MDKLCCVVVNNNNFKPQDHEPIPEKGVIKGPCTKCPPLEPHQVKLFQEVRQILENIAKKDKQSESNLERLQSIFDPANKNELYLDILNLHDSSEGGECDTLLHLASDASEFDSIETLLKAGANPNLTNRKNQLPLHTVVDEGDGCHCPACNQKNAKCVDLLLKQENAIADLQDWQGDTPLSCSALALMEDCATTLWNYGASIHTKGQVYGRTGELLADYIPDEICKWMDTAITQHKNETMKLKLDFGVLIGSVPADKDEYKKETHFLMYMRESHQKAKEKLLAHPLLQAYVSLKWEAVSSLFTLLRFGYLGMTLLYTYFIISFFLYHCPYEEALEEGPENVTLVRGQMEKVDFSTSAAQNVEDGCSATPWIYTVSGFLICFLVCMTLNELYEVAQGFQKYIKNGLNYGWLLMILTVTLNVLPVYLNFHGHWQYVVASFGVFLAWGMFLTQIARHPKIGIYVEMLGSIVVEFCIFAATYFVLIVGFAMAFTVLFPNNPMFEHVYGFLPFVKTLLMMNGEVDYETLFDEDENPRSSDLEYSIAAHIVFVGFVIVVTILLSNLLIGLTISDVQELRGKAALSRTDRLIQQIDLLETFFHKKWVPRGLKDWYQSSCSIASICAKNLEQKAEAKVEDGNGNDDHDKAPNVYRRIEGPIYAGFQPLLKTDKSLPEYLKEQFIRFVNTDECKSTKGGAKEDTKSEKNM